MNQFTSIASFYFNVTATVTAWSSQRECWRSFWPRRRSVALWQIVDADCAIVGEQQSSADQTTKVRIGRAKVALGNRADAPAESHHSALLGGALVKRHLGPLCKAKRVRANHNNQVARQQQSVCVTNRNVGKERANFAYFVCNNWFFLVCFLFFEI